MISASVAEQRKMSISRPSQFCGLSETTTENNIKIGDTRFQHLSYFHIVN